MDFLPEEFDEILNIFRGETEEIIQKINNNLLQLENNPNNKELLVHLFRDAHSLKGAARMIGFNNIQRLAHKAEDVLGLAKENKIVINGEISTALYKAVDLMYDLIQKSVKIKKEYYVDDIQKQIDYIDELLNQNQTSEQSETVSSAVEDTSVKINTVPKEKEKSFAEDVLTINALLSEAYLILLNINEEEHNSYIDTFNDVVCQLRTKFEQTDYFELKNEIQNICAKADFVIHNSNVLTKEEIEDVKTRLINIAAFLNKCYAELGIEAFDLEKTISAKQQFVSDESDMVHAATEEKTTPENSALAEFSEKMAFVKDGVDRLVNDLSQVPSMITTIRSITELLKKKETQLIVDKIVEILEIIRNSATIPEKEAISILKQSLVSVEKITFDNKEEADDTTLVIQRLDIVKQMLDLNSSLNPLSSLTAKLDESSLPVKKAQDFFNSFESTSIRTLRVDSKKLDTLVNQVGELIIARIKQKKNTAELEKIISEIAELKNFNMKSQSFIKYYDRKYLNTDAVLDYQAFSVFNKQIFSILQENSAKILKLGNRVLNLQKAIDEEDTKQTLIITQLESMIKNVRVLPLATIFHMFPRMIRDISTDTGKDIELLISGSETSADKKVIEEIKAPLMHIIRNSIDHGIESPEERIAAGKPAKGHIYLIAKSYQNKIIIEVHDDGRGIDLEKVLNRALEKNLITQKEANYLSAEQIMNIIFWPGFSTENVVTEISGRGVGLDIVQTKITQLNGTVKVFSVPNQGTKITIELPISMSTLKAFIVETSNQLFAFPMTAIKNVMWINEDEIYNRNGVRTIMFNGENVNIFYLNELMDLPRIEGAPQKRKTVIFIEVENSLLGIIVDKILGDQNILQKKLDPPIIKLKNISGVTTLANGEICLILNLLELYQSTYTPVEKPLLSTIKYRKAKKANSEYKILIVDDSITTRELLKNILSYRDYNYEMVTNPKEALDVLYKEEIDLILSDMEMPEMDGKTFVRLLKSHPKFKKIPVVIISSYDAEKLQRDIPDADGIIKKGSFNQNLLFEHIEKLLKQD